MTDLERRALLGDREAQEECTRQGIVLPCPFCGAKAEIDVVKKGYKSIISCKTHWCGFLRHSYNNGDTDVNVARRLLSIWNTRQAPPIVRCRECVIHNNCLIRREQEIPHLYRWWDELRITRRFLTLVSDNIII